MLLLQPNQVVSTDRLIEGLWGEHPPAGAANALQAHVASLRRVLEVDSLVTQPPGYALRVAPDDVDVARFERLVADGRDLRRSDPVGSVQHLADRAPRRVDVSGVRLVR